MAFGLPRECGAAWRVQARNAASSSRRKRSASCCRRSFSFRSRSISRCARSNTFTYTSCTAGTTTDSPCPGNLLLTTGLSGPNYFVFAFAQVSDTPGNLSALAETTAAYLFCTFECPPPPPVLSVSAQALIDDTYYTNGPARAGFIQLSVGITAEHVLFADDRINDGPYQYRTCPPGSHGSAVGCSGSARLPFELGIPFEVSLSAPVEPDSFSITPGENGHGGIAVVDVNFALFEADGSTPVPFYPTPEPSTYGLVLSAFTAYLLAQEWNRSRRQRRDYSA